MAKAKIKNTSLLDALSPEEAERVIEVLCRTFGQQHLIDRYDLSGFSEQAKSILLTRTLLQG